MNNGRVVMSRGELDVMILRGRVRLAIDGLQVAPAAEPDLHLRRHDERRPRVRMLKPVGGLRREREVVRGAERRAIVGAGWGMNAVAVAVAVGRGGFSEPGCAGGPDGREEDAEDGDVAVDDDHVGSLDIVAVVEDEDELRDVEDDREHEVGEGDPEERPEARPVRTCASVVSRRNGYTEL